MSRRHPFRALPGLLATLSRPSIHYGTACLLVAACGASVTPAPAQPGAPPADAFAFVRALDEAGARSVWPGFRPSDLPIALYDGEKTLLLRHPSPPPEFKPMPDRPGVVVAPGRYPAVVSNSTREIGGVRTATVVATPGQDVHGTLLACVEEVFHVFWLARHTSFRPNEMARYAYPVKDARNLERLLAEDEALARAIEAKSDTEAAAWAATALRIRGERTPALSEEARMFETALEMMEGTANYVARVALGEGPEQTAVRLRKGRPAEGIRWRFYDTGAAVCLLLDRLEPGWKARIDGEPDLTIVDLLEAALGSATVERRGFTEKDIADFAARTAGDVKALADRQERTRTDLLARPGARVVVECADGAEPFRVQRFDPINLLVLDGGEVAHANFITLSNASGSVEVTNAAFVRGAFAGTVSLTVAAGRHPLGDGVGRLTVTGIHAAPVVTRDGGTVTLEGGGIRATLRNAAVRTDGDEIRIIVSKAQPSSVSRWM